jgi:3-hydroxyisobutyrate dehydrogenase-like beta-hydroxyacid dehydrogenase
MSAVKKVAFLGLGIMGSRMARNLARKGFDVTVWNRTASRAEALAKDGARVAASPSAAAHGADAVCVCVADPRALREVALGAQGFLAACPKGTLVIDFSTVSPTLSRELHARAEERGCEHLEAPVTGSKLGAEKGTLLIMAGGTDAAFERAKPVFAAVGEKAILCGPIGAGSQVKLAGNALIALMLQGLSEGLLLTRKAGVDPAKLLEVVQASGFRSPYYDFKGGAVMRRDFETHFSIDLMFKDLRLFLESAAEHRVPTPTAAAVSEVYQLARAQGKGELDIAAVITALEDLCGQRIG